VRRLLTFIALALLGTVASVTALVLYPEGAAILTYPGGYLMAYTPLGFWQGMLVALVMSGSVLAAVAMALDELHRRRTEVPA
jgi:hypothetical protein